MIFRLTYYDFCGEKTIFRIEETEEPRPDFTAAMQWTLEAGRVVKVEAVGTGRKKTVSHAATIFQGVCLSTQKYKFLMHLPKENQPRGKERRVTVDGVTYPSIIAARDAFGFKSNGSVRWRCDHKELWPNWQWGDITP